MNNNIPDIWGAGSIFAYSGLDGESTFKNSLAGYLKSDKIGVIFDCRTAVELSFDIKQAGDVEYMLAASDAVHFITRHNENHNKQACFMFLNENTIVGFFHENAIPYINLGSEKCENPEEGIMVYSSQGEHIAFIKDNNRFALCVSRKSESDAKDKAKTGLCADIGDLLDKKYAYFEALPKPILDSRITEKTLAKCFSIMKSQVYTPENNIACRWTTPDRIPHKKMWLWDSVFHSIGNKYISKELAVESIDALFSFQREDGFIPHMMSPGEVSDLTQPPVIAWGFYGLYEYFKDESILKKFYEKTKNFLLWVFESRDKNNNNLFEWEVEENNPDCRCAECGMDNSPRFDNVKAMDCVDFSCFMANEARYMEKAARALGLPDEAKYWADKYSGIKKAINDVLWCGEDGFYFDRIVDTNQFKKVWAVSSFLPLFAGVCDKNQAEKLVMHLKDERKFNTDFPIPSIAADDKTFGTDMWRGPVWINYNYMVIQGLKEYGFDEPADELANKTLDIMIFWYEQEGVIYEFYDSENRLSPSRLNRKGKPLVPYSPKTKMQTIRDYGWSAALFADMILNIRKYRK